LALILLAVAAAVFAGAGDARAEFADISSGGMLADSAGFPVGVSTDGRFVYFSSSATNLVSDGPGGTQGYLRDRVDGTTVLPVAGYLPVAMSSDGRFLLVSNGGLWVFDRQDSSLDRVDVSSAEVAADSPGSATQGAISGDGRFVVFSSSAANLVAGDLNGARDVFLRDRIAETTTLVSASTAGDPGGGESTGAVISTDGGAVGFGSDAADLVAGDENADADIFARVLPAGPTQLVSVNSAGLQDVSAPPTQCAQAALSSAGRFVAFSCGEPNLAPPALAGDQRTDHAYVRDRVAGTTARADVDAGGAVLSANGQLLTPTISGDGRRAAFWANATFPGRLVLWDAVGGGRASLLDVRGQRPLLSQDGRTLAYQDIPTSASTAHVGVLPLAAPATDTQPPIVSCGAPDGLWHAADVTIGCTASDAGSGLADGSDASFGLTTDIAAGTENGGAATASRQVCDLAGNCVTAGPIGPIRVDRRMPAIACAAVPPPSIDRTENVVVPCTAADGGSGLVDAADGGFELRTTIAGGLADPSALTNARTVCDQVGNCVAAGPVGPYRIDRTAAPPSERDTDSDGIDDAADVCPVTAGGCAAEDDVGLPTLADRNATTRTAAQTAVTTCARPGHPAPLSSIAVAAGRNAGRAARRAIDALATNACAASVSTAAASVAASPAVRAAALPAPVASAGDAFIPTVRDVSDAISGLARGCRGSACRKIVRAAAGAAQGTSDASSDAIALTAARNRLSVARAAGDSQGKVLQSALVRVYEGRLAGSQGTRAASYRTFSKALTSSDVPTTLSRQSLKDSRGTLTKGIGIPAQAKKDLASAGIGASRITAAIVQSRLQAGPPTVTKQTGVTPRSRSRRTIAEKLAYDSVGRIIIALAAQQQLSFETTGRLLNTLDAARKACNQMQQRQALATLGAQAKGTKAAALVTTATQLLRTNTSLKAQCR
jgi:hypothetical protein